jgi:dienelactone hydrolase
MFEYFPGNYPWNLAVNSALNAGGLINEIDEACRPLVSQAADGVAAAAAWGQAWAGLGERVEGLAETDAKLGRARSAGHKYRRATIYHLVAERNMHSGDPRRLGIYRKALALFRRSVELLGEEVEWLEVPYQGKSLPALFVKARGVSGPAPCMVHFDGLDVMKELLVMRGIATELRERGVSVLLVDHPGVGEALRLRGMTLFPELEVPAKACVDYLETRQDVDPKRIGIIALSLGGYYAPRAAAYEQRFACCVAWGAIYDYGEIAAGRIRKSGTELSVSDWADHVKWVFGTDSLDEVLAITRRMTLEGVVDKITCPILITHGENDRQIPLSHAVKTYEGAVNSRRRELKVFTRAEGGVEHCQLDNSPNGLDYMSDWIAEVLGAGR